MKNEIWLWLIGGLVATCLLLAFAGATSGRKMEINHNDYADHK